LRAEQTALSLARIHSVAAANFSSGDSSWSADIPFWALPQCKGKNGVSSTRSIIFSIGIARLEAELRL
jgi:hypothetical protein